MRSLAACLLILAILAPVTMATKGVPDAWSASGEALWADVCLGDLSAGSMGPMLVGEHAGEYWFWVDATARNGNCEPLHREGWIHSPHADSTQFLRMDETGGSMVTFTTDEDGARSFELYEYTFDGNEFHEALVLTSGLAEQKIDGAGLV